jgi:hypothetical protein
VVAVLEEDKVPSGGPPTKWARDDALAEAIYASENQPHRDNAVFDYLEVIGDNPGFEPHWLLELVIITGMPVGEYRVPVAVDYHEIHARGTNPPL